MTDLPPPKEPRHKLQEREQFFRSIYDGTENVIVVINVLSDGEFRYAGWNAAHSRVAGFSSAEIVGKTPEEVFGPVEGAADRQRFNQCLQAGATVTFEECVTLQGQATWWLTTYNPLRRQDGSIYRIVGTSINITDRKQSEEALRRSEAQLREKAQQLEQALEELQQAQAHLVQSEKMSSLGQLVAGVAHEINNPVNFIYGNLTHASEYTRSLLELLHLYQREHPQPSPLLKSAIAAKDLDFIAEDLPRLLGSMRIGAERIREIVQALRIFSRLDEAEVKSIDIHQGIDSTLMILHSRLKINPESPEIQVIKHYGQLPAIECYAGQLNQVFMNILSNAIDALEEYYQGRSIADIEIHPGIIHIFTELTTPNQITIRFKDNAAGVKPEILARLFDPFFTTKPVGSGTGLGLSISHTIVTKRHGGRIYCRSQVGQGTEFVIELPIQQSLSAPEREL